MKVAILSPITWRTPPRQYGPWEQVASIITEGLVKRGVEVTLFATGDSITSGHLESVCKVPLGDDQPLDPKVWECLHISHLMEKANEFDIIHNHFDFLPLTYSALIHTPMLTTIHGFSSPQILPVYKKYNKNNAYISISKSDRHEDLTYLDTIYHGLKPEDLPFVNEKEGYLLYFGRIHPDKGTHLAIEIAMDAGLPLKIAGLIQDQNYFQTYVKPFVDGGRVDYLGNVNPVARNKLLGRARALLHPICFDEPFGLSVVEGMMCGTPVIAFERGSMAEIIVDGRTGFLVSDVRTAVLAVEKLKEIDPQECHNHACDKFSQDKMIEAYMRSYTQVLS